MKKKAGFTLVEIMITVAIMGLLVSIATPAFLQARIRSRTNICINNLRQIHSAKEQLAIFEGRLSGEPCTSAEIDTYLKGGTDTIVCPEDFSQTFVASYTINNIGNDPVCKIQPAIHNY